MVIRDFFVGTFFEAPKLLTWCDASVLELSSGFSGHVGGQELRLGRGRVEAGGFDVLRHGAQRQVALNLRKGSNPAQLNYPLGPIVKQSDGTPTIVLIG